MRAVRPTKPFASEAEYFLFEEKEETRNEFIDGWLLKMNGVSRYHNRVSMNVSYALMPYEKNGRVAFTTSFKVRTPDGNFLYPDIGLCESEPENYYTDSPVLIMEVLGDDTRTWDLQYKLDEYSKCSSLKYYLCIEPETTLVYSFYRTDDNVWVEEQPFTDIESVIYFSSLNISLSLKDIYNV